MKKIVASVLSLTLLSVALMSCGSKTETQEKKDGTTPAAQATTTEAKGTEKKAEEKKDSKGGLKTGLGIVVSNTKSKLPEGDKDGLLENENFAAAVLVDEAGKIVDCKLDAVVNKVNFDTKGALKTKEDTVFQSKNELAEKYGMKKASKLQKEWNEQAAAFAKYAVGKTVQELKGLELDEKGHAKAADITASVSVSVDKFIAAIEKAVNAAKPLGAQKGNLLGLGLYGTAKGSKDGELQGNATYAVLTVDAAGVVTSLILDETQVQLGVKDGKFTKEPKSLEVQSKASLGEKYGMKKASKIQKEWNEQVESVATYLTGKTAAGLDNLADQSGKPSADIASSVSINLTSFVHAIENAAFQLTK